MECQKPILDTISYNDTVPHLVIHRSSKKECLWTWQYHPHVEFILVLDGEIELQIEDEKRRLTIGDGALIFPFQPHCFTYDEKISCERFIAEFDPHYYGEFRDLLLHGKIQSPFFTAEQLEAVEPLNRQTYVDLCTEYPRRTELEKMSRRANFAALLAKIIPLCGVVADDATDEAFYRAAGTYCSEHFRDPMLSVEDVARAMNISRSKLNAHFSGKHGGIKAYINMRRIRYAELLLKNGDMSVAQVATEAGFSEIRTFNRLFKAYHGITPSQYRKK